jgi:hypothetical protein
MIKPIGPYPARKRAKIDLGRLANQGLVIQQANRDALYPRDRSLEENSTELLDSDDGSTLEKFFSENAPEHGDYNVCVIGAGENDYTVKEIQMAIRRSNSGLNPRVVEVEPYPKEPERKRQVLANRMEELSGVLTESQHVAIATYVHNYTQDKLRALMETHRILVPGGKALLNVNPLTPIHFYRTVGRQQLRLTILDLLEYLKANGHEITFPRTKSRRVRTILMTKNKPAIGLNARLVSTPNWKPKIELLDKWTTNFPKTEAEAHYLTNKRTFRRLSEFMAKRKQG